MYKVHRYRYMNFFLQNNVTIVTIQDSYLIIIYLWVTLKAFLMSPNVTHATRCHATAKKTDLEVFELTMWEKEARHIGGQEIKTASLSNALIYALDRIFIQFLGKPI